MLDLAGDPVSSMKCALARILEGKVAVYGTAVRRCARDRIAGLLVHLDPGSEPEIEMIFRIQDGRP